MHSCTETSFPWAYFCLFVFSWLICMGVYNLFLRTQWHTQLLRLFASASTLSLSSYLNIYKDSYYCINYLLIYNLKDLYQAPGTAGESDFHL